MKDTNLKKYLSANETTLKRSFVDPLPTKLSKVKDVAAHLILEIDDPRTQLAIACRFVSEHLDACRVDAGFGNAKDEIWTASVEHRNAASSAPSIVNLHLPNQSGVVQRVWKSATPVNYQDCLKAPKFAPFRDGFKELRTKSMVVQRLAVDRTKFGIMCVDQTTHARRWKPQEMEFLHDFCRNTLSPLSAIARFRKLQEHPILTKAEFEAVKLAAAGLTYKEIARRLGKSVRTIEHQLRNARQKTGATNQADLVLKCQPWL